MAIPETITESVGVDNVKTIAVGLPFYANLAAANAVANQQTNDILRQTLLGGVIKRATELDPAESVGILKATSGNEVAGTIAQLAAAMSSNQQYSKTAGNTPPVTP